jgi:hypothetical protein
MYDAISARDDIATNKAGRHIADLNTIALR